MIFNGLHEFKKEFKRLRKKYKSLPKDLEIFQKVLSEAPTGNSKNFAIMYQQENLCVIKARFLCRYLKGSSLRIIYVYFDKEKKIEFIEIYYKGKKESENKKRIKEYLERLT